MIVEALSGGAYRVELPNGHRVVGRPSGRLRLGFVALGSGTRVTLSLSPYDLSRGKIVGTKNTLEHESSSVG
jgi:translation initiation factor IF-1